MINKLIGLLLPLMSCIAVATPATQAQNTQTAVFAGGCFWCVQADFDKVPGVLSTTVGYDGGTSPDPNYKRVSAGKTAYAEAVKIIYDPAKVSYAHLLQVFWHNVDPTDAAGQFCDKGRQYRSAIFYLNATQRAVAEQSLQAVKKQLDTAVYTEIVPSTRFYPAEAYHQKYYKKNPWRYRFYRANCGRDKRLRQIWGDVAQGTEQKTS